MNKIEAIYMLATDHEEAMHNTSRPTRNAEEFSVEDVVAEISGMSTPEIYSKLQETMDVIESHSSKAKTIHTVLIMKLEELGIIEQPQSEQE